MMSYCLLGIVYPVDVLTMIPVKVSVVKLSLLRWSPGRDLNPRPTTYKAAAPTAELPGRIQKEAQRSDIFLVLLGYMSGITETILAVGLLSSSS